LKCGSLTEKCGPLWYKYAHIMSQAGRQSDATAAVSKFSIRIPHILNARVLTLCTCGLGNPLDCLCFYSKQGFFPPWCACVQHTSHIISCARRVWWTLCNEARDMRASISPRQRWESLYKLFCFGGKACKMQIVARAWGRTPKLWGRTMTHLLFA
jgi:hypothetical protein